MNGVRWQWCKHHALVRCHEGRFRYEVLYVTIEAGFVELIGIGFNGCSNAIVVADDPIVQHFLRHNAECEEHEQCT